jgi:YbgC/YbaW family acyl-CoA thioester hydrolase
MAPTCASVTASAPRARLKAAGAFKSLAGDQRLGHLAEKQRRRRIGIEVAYDSCGFHTLLHSCASYTFEMPRDEFRCDYRLRVRWAEVDMQKVVFNAHYLTYIDSAIAEYWRDIGLPYPERYVDRYGADVYLRKATVDYLGSAHYDDELAVLCRVAALGRTSMTMRFEIWREKDGANAMLVTADLVYVNVAAATGKPAPLPDELRRCVAEYERTAPVSSEVMGR